MIINITIINTIIIIMLYIIYIVNEYVNIIQKVHVFIDNRYTARNTVRPYTIIAISPQRMIYFVFKNFKHIYSRKYKVTLFINGNIRF